MKGMTIKKGVWWLLVIVLTVAVSASILLVYPYQNEHQTTVESILFWEIINPVIKQSRSR